MSSKEGHVGWVCLLIAALVLSLVANIRFITANYTDEPVRERAMDIINIANGTFTPTAGPSLREIRWMRDYCGGRDKIRDITWRAEGYPIAFRCDDFRDAYVPRDL